MRPLILASLLLAPAAACTDPEPTEPHVVLLYEDGVYDHDRIETGAVVWEAQGFTFGDTQGLPECGRHWDAEDHCEVTIVILADLPADYDHRYHSDRRAREVAFRADIRGRHRTVEAANAVGRILMDSPDDEQW